MWSDESKIRPFGYAYHQHVWQQKGANNEEINDASLSDMAIDL